MASEESKSALD